MQLLPYGSMYKSALELSADKTLTLLSVLFVFTNFMAIHDSKPESAVVVITLEELPS